MEVETRVPQGSQVSPTLFAIYPSRVFSEVEKEIEECMVTSFAYYYGWVVTGDSVKQLCQRQGIALIKAVEWEEMNNIVFNNSQDEILAFTRCQKPDLKRRLAEARITDRDHTLWFNIEATR